MAQTQEILQDAQVAVIEETGQDAYEAPDAGAVFLADINDPPFTVDSSNFERLENRSDFMRGREVPGPVSAEIQFVAKLKGSGGAADLPPEIGEFLKACGLLQTINGATSVVYTPASTFDGAGGNPGISYTCQVNGVRSDYAVKGAFGSFSIEGEHGVPLSISGSMMGAYVAPSSSSMLTPTYQNTIPPAFLGATVSLGGGTPVGVSAFALDIGNERAMGKDVTEATGFYGARITSRRITGSITVEQLDPATTDFFALWRAGAAAALTITVGSGTGGTIAISAPKITRRPPEAGSDEGIRTVALPFAVTSDNADAEGTDLSLTFS